MTAISRKGPGGPGRSPFSYLGTAVGDGRRRRVVIRGFGGGTPTETELTEAVHHLGFFDVSAETYNTGIYGYSEIFTLANVPRGAWASARAWLETLLLSININGTVGDLYLEHIGVNDELPADYDTWSASQAYADGAKTWPGPTGERDVYFTAEAIATSDYFYQPTWTPPGPIVDNHIQWDGYSDLAWQSETEYAEDALALPVAGAAGYKYRAIAGGETGVSEPSWPTTPGDTVVDGEVTWKCETAAGWQADHKYADGDQIYPALQTYEWTATVLRTSGLGEPAWNHTPEMTTDDLHIRWTASQALVDGAYDMAHLIGSIPSSMETLRPTVTLSFVEDGQRWRLRGSAWE